MIAVFFFAQIASADIIISASGVTTTIDFETTLSGSNQGKFSGAGFTPGAAVAGQLDSNSWSTAGFGESVNFGDSVTSGDAARGSSFGGVTTAGIYAFETGNGNVGLGVQPAGNDFTPGDITLRLLNDTGSTVDGFTILYDVGQYNDQNRSNSLKFEYSFDDSTWTSVASMDFISDETASGAPAWQIEQRSATITGLTLEDSSRLYFRWVGDDISGTGPRDEFVLDNIEITFHSAAVPESASIGLLAVLAGFCFFRRRNRSKVSPLGDF